MSSTGVLSPKGLPASTPVMAPPPPAPPTPTLNVPNPSTITSGTLPPAISLSNREMLAQIYNSVQFCDGLLPSERQILLGVLPNIPLTPDRSSFFDRLLALTPHHMKTLSQVLGSGLLAARNFGGRPSSLPDGGGTSRSVSKRSSVDDTVSDTTYKRPRLVSVSPQLASEQFPVDSPPSVPAIAASVGDIVAEEPMTAEICLLMHLGIHDRLPSLTTSERFSRGGNLAQDCLIRQGEVCPITGHSNNPFGLETAHLIPHSVAAIKTMDGTPFWLLLTICLGPDLRDQIYSIVGGSASSCSTNGLSLDSNIHALFDRGVIWLIPILDGHFDQATTTHYDVEFRWRGDLPHLQGLGTVLPIAPEDQVAGNPPRYNTTSALRSIQNRDVFRFFTPQPAEYPLTHPLLLSLHNMFWLMIESSGLTETARVKGARLGSVDGGSRPAGGRDSRGSNRRSIPRTPTEKKSGKEHRNATTRPSETRRPPPPAPTQDQRLHALPSIRMEYLDWKLNQLIALRSEINCAPDSDTDMASVYSDSNSDADVDSAGYFWDDEPYLGENGLQDECPCRNDWTANPSHGLAC